MRATYLTPAQLAAQCLRDDPSFALLPPAEQRAETRSVLAQIDGVDPDDIDLQMETMALAAEPVSQGASATRIVDTGRKKIVVAQPVAAAPVALAPDPQPEAPEIAEAPPAPAPAAWMAQPCRMPAGCTETLSATGRCMQCGAQRKQPVVTTVTRPVLDGPDPIYAPDARKQKSVKATRGPKRVAKTPVESGTPEQFARKRALLAEGSLIQRVKALTNAPDHYLGRILARSRPTVQAYLQDRITPEFNEWQLKQMHQLLLQQRLMLDDAIDAMEAALHHTRGVA